MSEVIGIEQEVNRFLKQAEEKSEGLYNALYMIFSEYRSQLHKEHIFIKAPPHLYEILRDYELAEYGVSVMLDLDKKIILLDKENLVSLRISPFNNDYYLEEITSKSGFLTSDGLMGIPQEGNLYMDTDGRISISKIKEYTEV